MAIDTAIFLEDLTVALADMPIEATFDNFKLNVLFQKVNWQETPLMEGIEQNSAAVIYITKTELGTNNIDIGNKVTINSIEYRVLSIDPYLHEQAWKVSLTDTNS